MIDANRRPQAPEMTDRSVLPHALKWATPLLIVSLFLLSALGQGIASPLSSVVPMSLPASGHGSSSVSPAASAAPATAPAAASSAGPSVGGGGGNSSYVENGTGTFFNNSAVQNVTTGHASCGKYYSYFEYCWNATLDPSVNVTTQGTTGMAYTVWTNDSLCPGQANATTEIGFVTSKNFGTTWATPTILGNPVCAVDTQNDSHYADAEMPALTSLSNGTFVLSYVESNISAANYYYYESAYPFSIGCYYTDYDRVVVTESYNNGSTWTTPTVIQQTDINYTTTNGCANPGTGLVRPSIAATGSTVYLAYTEYPYYFEDCCNYSTPYEGFLHLVVSTNGGASWTNATVPPDMYGSQIANYPDVIVAPNGTLYMAYDTGDAYNFVCSLYCTDLYNTSIVVAWSTDNGSSFNWSVVTQTAYFPTYQNYGSNFLSGPFPELAYSPSDDQLFVTFTSLTFGVYCYYYPGGYYCGYVESLSNVYLSNSSNGGLNWSSPESVNPGLINPNYGPLDSAYLPSIAVQPNGQVDLSYSVVNDSLCQGYYCGASQELYTYSDNNGSTWAQPALVDDEWNSSGCVFCTNGMEMYVGMQTATVTAGGQVLLAWPHLDNGIYGYAFWGYYGAMNIETSRLYTGAGITVNFVEKGLPAGAVWSANVAGYPRDGPAGSTLSLSGVPPSGTITYSFSWVNTSYGVTWKGTPSVTSPGTFASNSTVTVTFTEYFELNILSLPSLASYYWQYYTNYQIGSPVGVYWVAVGQSVTLWVNATTAVFCYPCLNLSWVAWVGAGNGSYSGTNTNPTITVNGPVNETATFTLNGYCYAYITPSCRNYTYAQAFIENGLPSGTDWGVSLANPNGTISALSGSTSALFQNLSNGITTFTAWTVPSSTSGEYWVPSSSSPSAFSEPNAAILINYTLESIANVVVGSWVTETGLPNQTAWTFHVGGYDSGTSQPTAQIEVDAGTSEAVNASAVYFEDGVGYYVKSITVEPLVINSSSYSLSPGGSTTVDGPAVFTFNYAPMYLVTTSASVGGAVSLASQWVNQGSTVTITATASTGYHFVSWTGSGPGSSTGSTTTITVKPTAGPVTEFATFRANFPQTWNVTFQASGLPAGTPFSIVVGGTTYTSSTTITIGEFSTGNYAVSAPTIYANSSNTTEFVPISLTSTAGLMSGVLNLTENVTLTVTYQTEYAFSVFATPGGSITNYPNGLYWEASGGSVSLNAVPAAGYEFAGWSGTVSSTSPSISVPINGVSNETAQFLVRPTPPVQVFQLTVVETGLPSDTAWTVSAGSAGIVGTASSLVIGNLNGSYQITAAPIFPATGIRWVSNVTNVTTSVTSNRTIDVNYWEQFQVSITATAGGSASDGASSSWVNTSSTLTLSATPNATSEFLSWNGSGTGSYSGTNATQTLTVTGPISEQASFGPVPSSVPPKQSTSSSNSNGETTTILVVVALLVAGLVVGLLVGRRRSPPPASASAPAESEPEAPPAEPEAAPADEPAPAIYDEGAPPS